MTTATPPLDHLDQLAAIWRHFASHEAGPYSPLYAAIATAVADDREVLALVAQAPPATHMPINLLAAVHYLVLGGIEHPLSSAYADGDVGDAPPAFRDLCLSHRDQILDVLATRRIQTNECGRSALVALALEAVRERCGPPTSLVDAGASAGLNLRYDRYHLDYGEAGTLGDPASPVRIECELRGTTLPSAAPAIARRVGLDRNPVDVRDPDARRWLLACVWPDTGRLERTEAALALAAVDPPEVWFGDMVEDIIATIDDVAGDELVCVLTSWALGYLGRDDRDRFVNALREAATRRPIAWLSLEAAGVVDAVGRPSDPGTFEIEPSVVGLVSFDRGTESAVPLALVHPHGKAYLAL